MIIVKYIFKDLNTYKLLFEKLIILQDSFNQFLIKNDKINWKLVLNIWIETLNTLLKNISYIITQIHEHFTNK